MAHSHTDTTANVTIATTRFGDIEVASNEILTFPEGLLGFNAYTRYVLIKDPEQDPFLWMQSTEAADLAFIVVDPFIFFPDYEVQIKAQELAAIELEEIRKANIVTIVTVPDDPMLLTANLRGPIVVNPEKSLAKQIVLVDDRYHTKHRLLEDTPDLEQDPPHSEPEASDEPTGGQ